MPGPGLFVVLAVIGVVLVVVANSRRDKLQAVEHKRQRGCHSDAAQDRKSHTMRIGTRRIDPHRGWTEG